MTPKHRSRELPMWTVMAITLFLIGAVTVLLVVTVSLIAGVDAHAAARSTVGWKLIASLFNHIGN